MKKDILPQDNDNPMEILDIEQQVRDNLEKTFFLLKQHQDNIAYSKFVCGIRNTDLLLSSLEKGDVIILPTRDVTQRLSIMADIICHAAIKHNIPTAFFSMEIKQEQVVNSFINNLTSVDEEKLRTNALNKKDMENLIKGIGLLENAPIYIDDSPDLSEKDLFLKCQQLKLQKDLRIVFVDNLDKLKKKKDLSTFLNELKNTAEKLEISIVLFETT